MIFELFKLNEKDFLTIVYDKRKKAKPSLVPFCFLLETHTVYKLIFEILFDLFKFAIFDLKFALINIEFR